MHVCMHACIYAVRGKPVVTLLVSLVKPEREGNVWLVVLVEEWKRIVGTTWRRIGIGLVEMIFWGSRPVQLQVTV